MDATPTPSRDGTTTPGGQAVATFERHRDLVYAWAYRVLGRHHDALDVVQDVFIRWLSQSFREPPQEARPWFRRVTTNRAIDLLRSRQTEARKRMAPARVNDPSLDPLEAEELRRDVAAGLARMTPMQRDVVVAKIYDDLTFSQIAEELGISTSSAKTHYFRGLSTMRDQLALRWRPREGNES